MRTGSAFSSSSSQRIASISRLVRRARPSNINCTARMPSDVQSARATNAPRQSGAHGACRVELSNPSPATSCDLIHLGLISRLLRIDQLSRTPVDPGVHCSDIAQTKTPGSDVHHRYRLRSIRPDSFEGWIYRPFRPTAPKTVAGLTTRDMLSNTGSPRESPGRDSLFHW